MLWLQNDLEEWCYRETLRMNERGIPIDRPLVDKTIKFLNIYNEQRTEECISITDGIGPTKVAQLLEWLQEHNVPVANLQRLTLERVLESEKLESQVAEVIKIRLEQGRVATKKLLSMQTLDSGDHVIRGSFIFHGASTGRFTARRVQPHNMQRPTIKNVPYVIKLLETEQFDRIVKEFGDRTLEAVGSCVRGFFKAPPGFLMVRADYNAIEARVLAWLAGQDDATLLFHEGADIYVDMAGSIYGLDPADIKAAVLREELEASEQRKLGKDTILGCGFNMGVKTFLLQMERKGSDKIAGIPIRLDPKHWQSTEKKHFNPLAWEMASKAVYGYRNKYTKIVDLWGNVEKATKLAIKNPGRTYVTADKRLKFRMVGHYLVMKLPSGRKIFYPYAEIYHREPKWQGMSPEAIRFKTVNSKNMWVWENTYGGKLVENAVQAIARDLMVNGMFHAARAGFKLIGTVHDEIISLHKTVRSKSRLVRRFEELVCILPDWAKSVNPGGTVPLAAEGVADERFGK